LLTLNAPAITTGTGLATMSGDSVTVTTVTSFDGNLTVVATGAAQDLAVNGNMTYNGTGTKTLLL